MSDPAPLFETFFILCGVGAFAALFVPARWSPTLLAAIASLAALIILGAGAALLVGKASFRTELWSILSLGTLMLEADRLSAFFLLVSGLVFLPVSLFSGVYLAKYAAHHDLRYLDVLYFALFASIVLILIAADAISFLIAWEIMSLTSYLLVTYEYEREESAQAGFVMLAMSEAGAVAMAIASPPLSDGSRCAGICARADRRSCGRTFEFRQALRRMGGRPGRAPQAVGRGRLPAHWSNDGALRSVRHLAVDAVRAHCRVGGPRSPLASS